MERVASVDDIMSGEVIGVEVDGTKILIARLEDEFYAIGDICTHAHCHLSDGWMEDAEVVCPCHHAKFDVTTGEATRAPATEDEPTYRVEVKDGDVFVATDT